MNDELWERKRENNLELISKQIKEILEAEDTEERTQTLDRIVERAGRIKEEMLILLTQLKIIAEISGQEKKAASIREMIRECDLENITMDVVYSAFPDASNDE